MRTTTDTFKRNWIYKLDQHPIHFHRSYNKKRKQIDYTLNKEKKKFNRKVIINVLFTQLFVVFICTREKKYDFMLGNYVQKNFLHFEFLWLFAYYENYSVFYIVPSVLFTFTWTWTKRRTSIASGIFLFCFVKYFTISRERSVFSLIRRAEFDRWVYWRRSWRTYMDSAT